MGGLALLCSALVALTVHASSDAEWRLHAQTWVDADKVLCGIGKTSEDALASLGLREEAARKLRAAHPSSHDVEAALHGSSRHDRLLASAAISVMGHVSDANVDGLLGQMQDPDPYTRLLAVRALRSAAAGQLVCRARAWTAPLIRERSLSVLLESFSLLEVLDIREATPVFGHMFELPDDRLHVFAYAILERLGQPSLESVKRYVERRGTARAQRAIEAAPGGSGT